MTTYTTTVTNALRFFGGGDVSAVWTSNGDMLDLLVIASSFKSQAKYQAGLTQAHAFSSTVSRQFMPQGVLAQRAKFSWAVNLQVTYKPTIAPVITIHETLVKGFPVTLGQNLTVHAAQVVTSAVRVIQALRLHDALGSKGTYGTVLAQTLQVRSILGRFFGAMLGQSMSVHAAVSQRYVAVTSLAENALLTAVLGHSLFLYAVVDDELILTDAELVHAIFKATLTQAIEIGVAYLSPNGNFSTWVMNTRTGAVTTYDEWAFNSFAQIGHKYIAADASGLYELGGDTDDGAPIAATLRSGLTQFGGSKFTSFAAAYLGLRTSSESQFYLKLVTGDGREYIYAARPQQMRTTKVHLGKGLRARYFAFELQSTGADFDLDSVEFIPIIAKRRVN